jgi:hypothetical protein
LQIASILEIKRALAHGWIAAIIFVAARTPIMVIAAGRRRASWPLFFSVAALDFAAI